MWYNNLQQSQFCSYNLTLLRVMQINNAGSNAYSYKPLAEASDEDLMWAFIHFSDPLFFPCSEFNIIWNLFMQWCCNYKHPWVDDMLSRGIFSFSISYPLKQPVFNLNFNFSSGNKDDVKPTERGSYIQHWWGWFRWKTNP